jgi:hypothetical protein
VDLSEGPLQIGMIILHVEQILLLNLKDKIKLGINAGIHFGISRFLISTSLTFYIFERIINYNNSIA